MASAPTTLPTAYATFSALSALCAHAAPATAFATPAATTSKAAATDVTNQLQQSIVSVQFPDRYRELEELSDRLGSSRNLPRIEEIEQLWYQMQREMVESGKIKHLVQEVITTQGNPIEADVVRLGTFNLLSGSHYLQYIPETGKVIDLNRQPAGYLLGYVEDYTQAQAGFSAVGVAFLAGAG